MADEPKADEPLAGTKVETTIILPDGCPFSAEAVVDAALRLFNKSTKHKFTHTVTGLPKKQETSEGKDTAEPAATGAAAPRPVNPHRSSPPKVTNPKTPSRAGSKAPPSDGTDQSGAGPTVDTPDETS